MWNINDYHKEDYFYRSDKKDWEFKKYGFWPCGLGDIIYNTARVIVESNNKTTQADIVSLNQCVDLLLNKARWPKYLEIGIEKNIANSWIDEKISYILKNIGLRDTVKYRSRKSITRDPYIMVYRLLFEIHSNPEIIISAIGNIPWYLYSPEVFEWRKALIGKRNIYKLFYKLNLKSKYDYVNDLRRFMREAYEIKISNKNGK